MKNTSCKIIISAERDLSLILYYNWMGTIGVRQVLGITADANVPSTLMINLEIHNYFIPNDSKSDLKTNNGYNFYDTNFELGGLRKNKYCQHKKNVRIVMNFIQILTCGKYI